MSRHFRINAPAVAAEVIDGEAVIMNLQSGHYFSAQGTGALVWECLDRGASDDDAAAELVRRYSVSPGDAASAVSAFVASLLENELVDSTGAQPMTASARHEIASLPAPSAWTPPALTVYTDMEDLLLLDPIHDVSEAGWPMPKATPDA